MDRFYAKLATAGVVVSIAVLCMGMGDRDKANIQLTGPSFVKLDESQGNFFAAIYEGKTVHYVKELSFSGSTSVGGVRKENDSSVRTLELSKIKEIKIKEPHYNGKFFKGQDFMVADILASTDYLMENMLIPKNITICGIDKNTLVEKAWFLYEVSKITIESAESVTVPVTVVTEQEISEPKHLKHHNVTPRKPVVDGWDKAEEKAAAAEALVKNEILKKKVATAQFSTGTKEEPINKTIMDAFWDIVDAIIDFFRALIASLLGIFGFN